MALSEQDNLFLLRLKNNLSNKLYLAESYQHGHYVNDSNAYSIARYLSTDTTIRTLGLELTPCMNYKNRRECKEVIFQALETNASITDIALTHTVNHFCYNFGNGYSYDHERFYPTDPIAKFLENNQAPVTSLYLSLSMSPSTPRYSGSDEYDRNMDFDRIVHSFKKNRTVKSLTLEFKEYLRADNQNLIAALSANDTIESIRIETQECPAFDEINKRLDELRKRGKTVTLVMQYNPSLLINLPEQPREPHFPQRILKLVDLKSNNEYNITIDASKTVGETLITTPLNSLNIAGVALDPKSSWLRYRKLLENHPENTPIMGLNNDIAKLFPVLKSNASSREKKRGFIKQLTEVVHLFDLDTVIKVSRAIQKSDGDKRVAFIHDQANKNWDKLRLSIFGAKGMKNEEWRTATFQAAMKLLKNRKIELEKNLATIPTDRKGDEKEAMNNLIKYQRSNFYHTRQTETEEKLLKNLNF